MTRYDAVTPRESGSSRRVVTVLVTPGAAVRHPTTGSQRIIHPPDAAKGSSSRTSAAPFSTIEDLTARAGEGIWVEIGSEVLFVEIFG